MDELKRFREALEAGEIEDVLTAPPVELSPELEARLVRAALEETRRERLRELLRDPGAPPPAAVAERRREEG